jgi:hypothetical protein
MSDTIRNFRESIKWQRRYGHDAPKRGELASEFELWDVSGENRVRLSDFRGNKPVALIFGSFT